MLDLPSVGLTEHFVRLGGDSLSGARIASRLGERYGIQLTLTELLDHPTVQALSALIDTRTTQPGSTAS
jgi:acyl carrier protein